MEPHFRVLISTSNHKKYSSLGLRRPRKFRSKIQRTPGPLRFLTVLAAVVLAAGKAEARDGNTILVAKKLDSHLRGRRIREQLR